MSPHGHTDPQWFADDAPFANASALLITPDHCVFRMLYSRGVPLEALGIPRRSGANEGSRVEQDPRKIWRTFARELAPLAGHHPILRLGPSWWFYDSPEGVLRFREQTTETAGFYNTVGFNDDTRAFQSIPARHDVARRIDCRFLATLAVEHKIGEDEAFALAPELARGLAKRAYKL